MLQPVLLVMDVPDDTNRHALGVNLEQDLREAGWKIRNAVPMAYTLDVPRGMVSR